MNNYADKNCTTTLRFLRRRDNSLFCGLYCVCAAVRFTLERLAQVKMGLTDTAV